jgi:tripeptide aminopeptidase
VSVTALTPAAHVPAAPSPERGAAEQPAAAGFRVEAVFAGSDADAGVILAAAQAIVALGARAGEEAVIRVETIQGAAAPGEASGRCRLVADVAATSYERAEAAVAEAIDCLHDAANRPECSSDLDISVQRTPGLAR